MTIRALAFDLDGTLCHTLPDLVADGELEVEGAWTRLGRSGDSRLLRCPRRHPRGEVADPGVGIPRGRNPDLCRGPPEPRRSWN